MKTQKNSLPFFCFLLLWPLTLSAFTHFELTPRLSEKREATPSLRDQIEEVLLPTYQATGQKQSDEILKYNQSFDLGTKNFSGFSWQKPIGDVYIGVDRTLAPDLHREGYFVVQDRFVLTVDAQTYLKGQEKIGNIQNLDIRAFAGISFQRVYTYYHYEKSYEEGLTSDFSKLFLNFSLFDHTRPMLGLLPYEVVKKEDYFSFSVGATVVSPVSQYYLTGAGGVMVNFQRVAQMTVSVPGPLDNPAPGEILRVIKDKTLSLGANINLSALLDFKSILKITLLRLDLEYDFTDTKSTYLRFFEKDREDLLAGKGVASFLRDLFFFKPVDPSVFGEHLISYEEHKRSTYDAPYKALLVGGIKQGDSHYDKVEKEGVSYVFFKSVSRSYFYIKSLLAPVFNVLDKIFSLYAFPMDVLASWEKTVEIEYAGKEKLVPVQNIYIPFEESLSIVFMQEYKTAQTRTFVRYPFKYYALDFIDRYTSLDEDVYTALSEDEIHGPLIVRSLIRLQKSGLLTFDALTKNQVISMIDTQCRNWYWPKRFVCSEILSAKYHLYRFDRDHSHKWGLWTLKMFLNSLQRFSYDLTLYKELFGEKNVFVHGLLKAQAPRKKIFQTYFSEGEFEGLGVKDDFIRKESLQYPVSIPY